MTKINHWGQWQAEKTNPLPEERRMERPTDPALMNGYWRKVGARTEFDEPIVIWTEEDAERNPDGWSTVLQWGFDEKNNHWSTPHIIDETSKRWVSFIGVGWLKCIAVSKADWSVAVETGRWPDGKPARRMSTEEKLGIDVEAGDNAAPVEESLGDQIATLADKLAKAQEPTSADEASKLAGDLDRMRILLKKADEARVAEKEPFLEGGRKVDAKFKAIVEPGSSAYTTGTARQKAWLRKEQARLDAEAAAERNRLQEIANQENERIRQENAARMAEAQQHGTLDQPDAEPELLPEVAAPPVVEAPRAKAGSAFGRASGLRRVQLAVVDDPMKLATYFLDSKDADFAAYLQTRAAAALRGKIVLPGCLSKEELQ